MASLRELENDYLAGFDPEWDEYTGRAYRQQVRARSADGKSRTWTIGLWHETEGNCDYFAYKVSRQDWRSAVSSRLRDGDVEVSTEVVYKDYRNGKPMGRVAVLKGVRYPIASRAGKPSVQWSKGEHFKEQERRPMPSDNDILSADIGSGVRWHVFTWDGEGWSLSASLTKKDHKDALVAWLRKQGEEVYVSER